MWRPHRPAVQPKSAPPRPLPVAAGGVRC